MRELRDREDVDEVEEQLDRGRRLRRAVAARAQVTDRIGDQPVTAPAGPCGRRRRSGAARDRRALGRQAEAMPRAAPGGPRGARGSGGRAGTASRGRRRGARGPAPSRGAGRRRRRRGSPAAGTPGARRGRWPRPRRREARHRRVLWLSADVRRGGELLRAISAHLDRVERGHVISLSLVCVESLLAPSDRPCSPIEGDRGSSAMGPTLSRRPRSGPSASDQGSSSIGSAARRIRPPHAVAGSAAASRIRPTVAPGWATGTACDAPGIAIVRRASARSAM